MKSNHVANAVLVACVVGLAAWWWWPANPPPVKTPPVLVRSPQPVQTASPQPEVTDEVPPYEPTAADLALLQAMAQEVFRPQRQANELSLMSKVPPGGRLTMPLDPGRPSVAGQTIITEQSTPDGRLKLSSDKLEGYIEIGPPGEEEYQPVYSRRETTTTADKAEALRRQFEADAAQPLAP